MTTTLPAGWKPISSAPKDGTPVLAFWTGGTEAATVYGRSYGITMFKRGEWVNVDSCDDTYSEPTHWMPLPAAPCQTCGSHGMVGGLTPHSGYDAEPCPECTPPATTQDAPITVTLDPDPRGVSVGVWQGSRCIYNGAHAVPVGAQDDAKDERQAFEAWAKKKKMPLARIGQQYDDFWVDHAWNGWQARAALAAPAAGDAQTTAARDVLAERQRQIRAEGWTPDHDDEHSNGEIAYAATSYAVEAAHLADGMKPSPTRSPPFSWPPQWDTSWWKPSDTPRRNLVKAGALILAEIERLDRAAASQQQEG